MSPPDHSDKKTAEPFSFAAAEEICAEAVTVLLLCPVVFRRPDKLHAELCLSSAGQLSAGGQRHRLLHLTPQWQKLHRWPGQGDPHGDLQLQRHRYLRDGGHGGFFFIKHKHSFVDHFSKVQQKLPLGQAELPVAFFKSYINRFVCH